MTKTKIGFATFLLYISSLSAMAETPRPMALLPEGQYHSFEPGFNIDNSRSLRRAIATYQDTATKAGMQVKPFEIAWPDIEITQGQYELDETIARFQEYVENGWRPLVYLRAVDSDDVTVPAYLKGTDDAVALSEIDVSSPEFIAAYNRLMDVIVPLVREYNGFAIMVANEPDNFLTPNPHLTDQVVTFVTQARRHIHQIDSKIAVGVTLSNGFDHDDDLDAVREPLPHHLALIAASDIAAYNLYCLKVSADDQARSIRSRLQSRIAAADGRDIIIQELGCPSGADAGFSEEFQRHFFEQAFIAMEDTSVRVSVVFQLVDWSDATIQFYGEALKPLFEAEPAFRDNPNLIFLYLDQLGSIGVIDAADGSPKPAWFEFLDVLKRTTASDPQ